jgi:hypothetical protein
MASYLDNTPISLLKKERTNICIFIDQLHKREGIRTDTTQEEIDKLINELEVKVQEYNVSINTLMEQHVIHNEPTNSAHLIVSKGYSKGIDCHQNIDDAVRHAEEWNAQLLGEDYMSKDRERAVITVLFNVPDKIFKREHIVSVTGTSLTD